MSSGNQEAMGLVEKSASPSGSRMSLTPRKRRSDATQLLPWAASKNGEAQESSVESEEEKRILELEVKELEARVIELREKGLAMAEALQEEALASYFCARGLMSPPVDGRIPDDHGAGADEELRDKEATGQAATEEDETVLKFRKLIERRAAAQIAGFQTIDQIRNLVIAHHHQLLGIPDLATPRT